MMKISQQWLKEWINIDIPTTQLVEQLTMAGLEIENYIPIAPHFSKVVIGQILSIGQHPKADRLKVCLVDIGQNLPLTIVCGASNIFNGLKIPVALVGASLNGKILQKIDLRGVQSEGMLCSAEELGLLSSSDGILELSADAPIGVSLADYLQLNDQILEIALTANRGDCASVRGIAREIAAIHRTTLLEPIIAPVAPLISETFPIQLVQPEACPHYTGRILRNVNLQVKTPVWMQERLNRCGVHCVHPIVDVTNYIMLEWGQPMHAFDFSKLNQGIFVRWALPHEKLQLLSGEEVTLTPDTLVIADSKGAIAMAGIMGGLSSSITEKTQHIFLESAFFSPAHIANRARQYGLQTESSYRFEHGVDSELQILAIERATKLLMDIIGGEPGPILDIKNKSFLRQTPTISFKSDTAEEILGIVIPQHEMKDILTSLGMNIQSDQEKIWQIKTPSYRFDLSIEEDIVEEIARIYGYHHIPPHSIQTSLHLTPFPAEEKQLRQISHLFKCRGYHEVIHYSFIHPTDQRIFDPKHNPLPLVNPIIQDFSVMRSNLWPGLVNALIYNLHHQQNRVRLFETGQRFYIQNSTMTQEQVLSGLVYGPLYSEQWGTDHRFADFFDVKGDIESLFALTGLSSAFDFQEKPQHEALHPQQNVALFFESQCIGYLGRIHPHIAQIKDIPEEVYLFELIVSPWGKIVPTVFSSIPKFPTIRRDLSWIVDQEFPVKPLLEKIRQLSGKRLIHLLVFDIYEGSNIPKNKKNIGLGLIFQDQEKTLQEEEIDEMIQTIVQQIQSIFNIQLRESHYVKQNAD